MKLNFSVPNYANGSLVNLMSTIMHHFGGKSLYSPLKSLPVSQLNEMDNIVLITIDGLGYNYFTQNASSLKFPITNYLHAKITSVFPSTTAAAMTTIYTGVAPKNHGCLAWFTYLKELGVISTIPPLKRRHYDDLVTTKYIKATDILQFQSIFTKLPNIEGYFVISEKLKDTPYDSVVSQGARSIGFTNFSDSINQIYKILQTDNAKKKFILHYWDGFDAKCHTDGISNSVPHFVDLFTEIHFLFKKITQLKKKTAVIVTADHGMVDVPENKVIYLKDHDKLEETLTLPLCGEGRVPFCYVRAPYKKQFESYINKEFQEYCDLLTMEDLLNMELFGLSESHPRFKYRIPDYCLLMKENYILVDNMLKENRFQLKAVHGGLSDEELYVPLIVFKN
ncbi:MAG: alkaline phosphatase family protein [Candidatus Lokiarchaeota archaeon]|nr:alkaline phosphatase family protein [Candidatus Lokiarchaeota archaeon]